MNVRSVLLVTILSLLGGVRATPAGDLTPASWDAWERLPVFDHGRTMPLDTFARNAVSGICGRESPRLGLEAALPDEETSSDEYAAARKLFPDGQSRKFSPSELLLSWLVEPGRWHRVPFLVAEHHTLREEVLGLPLVDGRKRKLRYVSPYEVENSAGLQEWRLDVVRRQREAEDAGEKFEWTGVDQKANELYAAFYRWRQLTFRPGSIALASSAFQRRLGEIRKTWNSLAEDLRQFHDKAPEADLKQAIGQIDTSLRGLDALHRQGKLSPREAEPLAAQLRSSADATALWFRARNQQLAANPPKWEPAKLGKALSRANKLASLTEDLARQTAELQLAMFDNGARLLSGQPIRNGGTLRVVPVLNRHALEVNRTEQANPQPWLALGALVLGSDATLADYPAEPIAKVKGTFAQVAAAYVQRDAPDRAERFAGAMDRFAAAVRELGEVAEPIREKLPVKNLDEKVLAKTAYPPAGVTDVELHYNRFQPFLWSWIASLVSVVLLALSFGLIRKPMFWSGLAALIAAQAFIVHGLALRTYITRWAPVTNMFETVVFVALVVAGLGIWFTLLPMLWRGIVAAWELTAAPMTWEIPSGKLDPEEPPLLKPAQQNVAHWLLLVPRAFLMFAAFYFMTQVSYGEGEGYTAISLAPRVDPGAAVPTFNDLLTWAVGLCLLIPSAWYAPRAFLTAILSLATVPLSLVQRGAAKSLGRVMDRKPYAFAGAAVALIAALAAYYVPIVNREIFDSNIGALNPVLRDNFWLTIHVLSITASYGAGALALGLGNVALFHYLFGRYRNPAPVSLDAVAQGHRPAGDYVAPPEAFHHREPAACATLGGFTYKATQVAVLLLAAGTITGALWADVAWGRFWGWDAKEVWALISLLIYILILHGRYAGWFGNFGLAAFSVAGATSILMAWYGVNFVLGTGLHTYGQGAGGLGWVLVFVGLNWLFAIAAWLRYRVEIATTPDEAPPSAKPVSVEIVGEK